MVRHNLGHSQQVRVVHLVPEVGNTATALLEAGDYGQSRVAFKGHGPWSQDTRSTRLVAPVDRLGVDQESALRSALHQYEARFARKGHCGSA